MKMAAEIFVLNEIIDASIEEELLLDYEEDGEFLLISATAAFLKRNLKIIVGFCEVVVPSYAIDEFRSPFRSSPQDLAATGQISPQENRTFSSSHFDASHVTQIKIGVWPGTGFEWEMVSTISAQIFRLGILDYLSRRFVYFGKFPFGQTKTVLPFTSQPKFLEFFGKWYTTEVSHF